MRAYIVCLVFNMKLTACNHTILSIFHLMCENDKVNKIFKAKVTVKRRHETYQELELLLNNSKAVPCSHKKKTKNQCVCVGG